MFYIEQCYFFFFFKVNMAFVFLCVIRWSGKLTGWPGGLALELARLNVGGRLLLSSIFAAQFSRAVWQFVDVRCKESPRTSFFMSCGGWEGRSRVLSAQWDSCRDVRRQWLSAAWLEGDHQGASTWEGLSMCPLLGQAEEHTLVQFYINLWSLVSSHSG